ncbi:heme-binding protein [Methylosinus sp. R-45379]|uniref:heme-binding protein n=1 Tax=Methylosinus sp. R-45379 TaxID=980563 RepID=UPI000B18C96E|nr:heme-binding protein [Methylosinus sp. R-45379]
MKIAKKKIAEKLMLAGAFIALSSATASAHGRQNSCSNLPSWSQLRSALIGARGVAGNNGLGLHMWATIVANDGTVCAVAFTGSDYRSQWLASRVISAQKANAANGLSLSKGVTPSGSAVGTNGLALSTANLYSAVQPGGSLFGLQFSNPVDPDAAYEQRNGRPADAATFGQPNDPMVGDAIGGVNVFGGGLALYGPNGVKIGGIGVSGDTSCTDHMVAWRARHSLNLDYLSGVGGVNATDATRPDNIIFDISGGASASGWGHPNCAGVGNGTPVLSTLPAVQ